MGGEQSHERKEREEEEAEKQEDSAKTERSADGSQSAASPDAAGELPQCRMGNRKVDNMCFMISCTNWY